MNAVEIEEAVSELASQPFDRAEFAYQFLAAFGNKETTIKRLRAAGGSNASDVTGGILQRSNIHLATCAAGEVDATLKALRDSPKTASGKTKFILATDGETLQAEDVTSDDPPIACEYAKLPDHFGFFLPLAGITTVKQIRESSFDIRATGRLNKLYVELLKDNPEWATAERRPDMNHFMARLIFCFFAEDTDIFNSTGLFSAEVQKMSEVDSSNTHEIISHIFLAMNTPTRHDGKPDNRYREAAGIRLWANRFPYVNGGLFSGSTEVPRFSKIARSYLINIGSLDWKKINPDIFGSMIQAVADDEERGALGMHYTSVPNILKVLNPLFLDDLREQLHEAGDNGRKLLNLRNRMAKIRVFDPACGSGNFLVIAYKEMRAIEAAINQRREEQERRSDIPLTNFRGIELRNFPAEIARLALIIAEYQCDVTYRGQQEALAELLPLNAQNWITCGNALRIDWLTVCEPVGKGGGKIYTDDLFGAPLDQAKIDFENEGGETYLCGNPPYLGSKWQSAEQKSELMAVFKDRTNDWKSLDYVAGWFMKAADFGLSTNSASAFVATNSICQGQQVPILWPLIFKTGHEITFAHTSFKWANLASHNAGVTVSIVGISKGVSRKRRLFSIADDGGVVVKEAKNINPYLAVGQNTIVEPARSSANGLGKMLFGNMPRDGGHFILTADERMFILNNFPEISHFVRPYMGSEQMIQGKARWCIWILDEERSEAEQHPYLAKVLKRVSDVRLESPAPSTRDFANKPHRFVQIAGTAKYHSLAVAKVSSENRPYIPIELYDEKTIISDLLFALYDAPLWNMAFVASRIHMVWIATVCGKMKTDFRYSNTLGWNTFPVPTLTEKNKEDLTVCAEDIILARESHFPATIADLYTPGSMPDNLRAAHDRNDETLERIYIGRRFKNDTERLEKLFELYSVM